jgi:hypothetical protein
LGIHPVVTTESKEFALEGLDHFMHEIFLCAANDGELAAATSISKVLFLAAKWKSRT